MLKLKNNLSKLSLVILSISFVVTAIIFFLPSPSNAELNITWSPESITETVSQGETKTILVRIKPDKKMDDVEFEISDTLEPFVHIEPSSFSRIRRNETVELSITISADMDSALGSYEGFISLENEHRDNDGEHDDRKIERAKISKERDEHEDEDDKNKLHILINVFGEIIGNEVSLKYSPYWQFDTNLMINGGPINLNNFSSLYSRGGIIPQHGAEINITKINLPISPLLEIIASDFNESEIESITDITISGLSAKKIVYRDFFTTALVYKNIAIYVIYNNSLFKVFLSYNNGDTNENEFLREFQEIIETVNFI